MKKKLQAKLKKYSAMAAATGSVIAASDINAQVVYTDLNPDSVFTNFGDTMHLDLNNDAIIDFDVVLFNYSYSYSSTSSSYFLKLNLLKITPKGTNMEMGTAGSSTSSSNVANYPSALNLNNTISSGKNWINGGYISIVAGYYFYSSPSSLSTRTFGKFLNSTDKYLGLKFDIAGSTHYGWVRLAVNADASAFTIKDYAYDATPDQLIMAGQRGAVGIENHNGLTGVNLFVRQKELTVNVKEKFIGNEVQIIDITGRVMETKKITSTTNKFSLSHLSNGVYLVSVKNDQSPYVKKVIVQ